MKPNVRLTHQFVDLMPEVLADNTVYVSIKFATAVHKCVCGCGMKVVTPIKPTAWSLTFNGDAISMWPSVGNWGFPCRSHYIIDRNVAVWAGDMPQEIVDRNRQRDQRGRDRYYGRMPAPASLSESPPPAAAPKKSWWQRLLSLD